MPSPTLTAALEYVAAGFRVFPCWWPKDGGCACPGGAECGNIAKHPVGSLATRGVLDATDDEDVVTEWWSQLPDANVAIATGAGLMVVDVDPEIHGVTHSSGLTRFAEIRKEHDWKAEPQVWTPRGGRHLYLGVDEQVAIRNAVGLLPGIDIRGDGGYVVAPPSVGANGRAYAMLEPSFLDRIEAAPGWLLQLVATAARESRDAPACVPRSVAGDELSRIQEALAFIPPNEGREDWMTRVTMPLHDYFGGSEEGFRLWHAWCASAGGRATPSGRRAYRGERHCRGQWASLRAGHRNPKGIRTFWQHAMSHGWQPTAPAADIVVADGILRVPQNGPGSTPNGEASGVAPALVVPDATAWPRLEPLDAGPGFPELDLGRAFPPGLEWLREFVQTIAELVQVPVELPAVLSLAMAAGAGGRKYEIAVDGTDWSEPLALWVMCAMRSGGGKTPVFNLLLRPFKSWDDAADKRHKVELGRWNGLVKASETVLRSLQTKVGRQPDDRALRERFAAEHARHEQLLADRPQSDEILGQNFTPAGLVEHLEAHHLRCLIADDEGTLFNHALGGKTSAEKDIDPFVKAYSGGVTLHGRVGRRRRLPTSCLSMAVCTQEESMDLFRDQFAAGKGFLARFVAALFPSPLPDVAIVRGQVPPELHEQWRLAVHGLLGLTVLARPRVVPLTGACGDLFEDWSQTWLNEAKRDSEADAASPVGWGSAAGAKIRSNVLRIILALHCLRDPTMAADVPIDVDTVRAATEIWAPWIIGHVRHTTVRMHDDPAHTVALRMVRQIQTRALGSFSRGEMADHLRGHTPGATVTKADDLNPAIELLRDKGWIRPKGKETWRRNGTVCARYDVNPEVRP